MSRRSQRPVVRWLALVLALAPTACRGRTPVVAAIDWRSAPGTPAEIASLLLLDGAGVGKVVCFPTGREVGQALSGMEFERVLDVAWKGGVLAAGWPAHPKDGDGSRHDLELALPNGKTQVLATGVRTARFSPDASALAYEVSKTVKGRLLPTSYVFEVGTGKMIELGALTDPLWEHDSKHLRATMLREVGEAQRSLRVRWDREAGALTIDGPGSGQIPPPVGDAVAWSEARRGDSERTQCTVYLDARGGVRHSVVGRTCTGVADDRAIRWAPDGHWLAFAHPQPGPAGHPLENVFVDVVGIEGGRSPALSALRTRVRSDQLLMAFAPEPVWFDWSPSGRLLAVSDGSGEIRVYDFEAKALASLGNGQRPTWSPGGTYLSILAGSDVARSAFVLAGARPGDRIGLGEARDARWLPAEACSRSGSLR